MQAVIEAAYAEADAPWELVEVWLCDALHCTPEQLDEMDSDRILQYWTIKNTYAKYNAQFHKVHKR